MSRSTLRRNRLGFIPLAAAAILTIVGIVLNLSDHSGANRGGPFLNLGGMIAVATLAVVLIVNALRGPSE
ncbi:hypothetical protein [Leifsonia sp. NCR5]|uniref:hypothetical protein n=1 Tax=Leifsonia sp. NCR5 TaxID=1978342 RepID=UPI000A18EF48|nr:hypothetical protein [Leifsonia sp. NCR5]